MFLVFCPLCYLQVYRSGMIFFFLLLYLPERASPLCRTSSIFATIILWTSCSSVLMLPKFLLALLSTYAFFVFWMYVSGTIYVLDISLVNGFVPSAKNLKDTVSWMYRITNSLTKLDERVWPCHCRYSSSILVIEFSVEVLEVCESHLFGKWSLTEEQVAYTLCHYVAENEKHKFSSN